MTSIARLPPSEATNLGDNESLATRSSLLGRLRDLSDDASWRTFFNTYWRLIYNVARKSGLSDDAAQEIVQETVVAVARKMPEFRYDSEKGSFKHWLLLISRRRIMDHFRRRARALPHVEYRPEVQLAADESIASSLSTSNVDFEAAWEQEWKENVFQMALSRVRQRAKPKHYQVFDYCVLQNLRPREVARMLGLNVTQVYLAKHRTIAAVKQAVKEIEAELGKGSA
jgi:RNA polymerase sigma factor (sigma-70 family)